MEDLFNMIANTWDNGTSWNYGAPMTQEMMDDSVARAQNFFDVGGSLEMGLGDQNPLGFEGVSHFVDDAFGFKGFEGSFFNPAQFEGMGLAAQDGLDLLMTYEGTQMMLNGMDTGFNSFQEELCCDYMAGVRAGLIGMDVSQIEHSFAELPQQIGHADGDYRAAAFAEGVAFANGFMGTHGLAPSFMDCFESCTDGQVVHGLADMAQLGDQLYAQECEMAHYRGLVEAQPDNEWARQQYQVSEEKYHIMQAEFEQKQKAFMGEDSSMSESMGASRHGILPSEGEYHPTFGYKDGLYTKEEIEAHKNEAKGRIDHQRTRIAEITKKMSHEAGLEHPRPSKLSSLETDLNDAKGKLKKASDEYKAWCNTEPKKKK